MVPRLTPNEVQLPTINVTRAVEDKIPGLKTSAVFFASLRANLSLSSDLYPSPASSPPSLRGNHADISSLSPPSPLSFVARDTLSCPSIDEENVPHAHRRTRSTPIVESRGVKYVSKDQPDAKSLFPLLPEPLGFPAAQKVAQIHQLGPHGHTYPDHTVYLTSSELETAAALTIVADSVADQQRLGLYSLFTHPLHLVLYFLVLYSTKCLFWTLTKGNTYNALLAIGATWFGVSLTILALGALIVRDYTRLSNGIFNEWLGPVDEVLVIKCADTTSKSHEEEEDGLGGGIVGCVVLEWTGNETPRAKKQKRSPGRGFVRAWAVSPSYRGRGFGTALLRETAALARQRGGALAFSQDHAHSERVLADLYNRFFDRRDRRACEALRAAIALEGGTDGFAAAGKGSGLLLEHGRRSSCFVGSKRRNGR